MNNFFDTEEDRTVFLRRLGALAHNTDFCSVLTTLMAYQDELNVLIRYVEDETKFRHLQGRAQVIGELLELCEQAKLGQF